MGVSANRRWRQGAAQRVALRDSIVVVSRRKSDETIEGPPARLEYRRTDGGKVRISTTNRFIPSPADAIKSARIPGLPANPRCAGKRGFYGRFGAFIDWLPLGVGAKSWLWSMSKFLLMKRLSDGLVSGCSPPPK